MHGDAPAKLHLPEIVPHVPARVQPELTTMRRKGGR